MRLRILKTWLGVFEHIKKDMFVSEQGSERRDGDCKGRGWGSVGLLEGKE